MPNINTSKIAPIPKHNITVPTFPKRLINNDAIAVPIAPPPLFNSPNS